MNDLTPTRQEQPSEGYTRHYEAEGLSTELAKMLALVAPVTMSADQQAAWIISAVDALRDIRADEVAAISLEVRRSVTRPSQIVPEIAELVAERRNNRVSWDAPRSPFAEERRISEERQRRCTEAKGDRAKIAEAFDWERGERLRCGLSIMSKQAPFTQTELDRMKPNIAELGIKLGYLRRENGRLAEVP